MRITFLDGLKGIGCLMVFLGHFRLFGFTYPRSLFFNNIFVSTLFSGNLAVCLFLIISAFLICNSYKSNRIVIGGISRILLKRYFRLAIPIGLILIIISFIHVTGIQFNSEASALNNNEMLAKMINNVGYRELIKSIFLIPLGFSSNWLKPAWMIKYIFYGTFLALALFKATEKISLNKTVLICVFYSILFYFIDVYYIAIIIGFALFKINETKQERGCKFDKFANIIAFLSFSLFACIRIITKMYNIPPNGFINIMNASLIICFVCNCNFCKKILSSRPLLWLGKISFSLYLWHVLVMCTFTSYLYIHTKWMDPSVQCMVLLISSTFVLFTVSWLSQMYIEASWARKIQDKIMYFLES